MSMQAGVHVCWRCVKGSRKPDTYKSEMELRVFVCRDCTL